MMERESDVEQEMLSHNAIYAVIAGFYMVLIVLAMLAMRDLPISTGAILAGMAVFIVLFGYSSWYWMSAHVLNDGKDRVPPFVQFLASILMLFSGR